MNNFQIITKIGQGAFASVYKVKRKQDGKIYALKKIKLSSSNNRQIANSLNQVRILASINNPYIVSYKQAFYQQTTSSLCMVTEFAQGGDLSSFIASYRKKKQSISQQDIWRLTIQMIYSLKTLHKMNIFHRDIKSANIFLTKNYQQVKIGDMNVSILSKSGMATTQTGTPYYTSPQVWKDMPYNGKCDIWSLGCVIYQMAAQCPPFLANDLNSLKKKAISGHYDRIPKLYSQDLQSFIRLCLTTNINQRLSADNLLHSNYIRKRIHLYPQQKFNNQTYQKVTNNQKKLLQTIKTPINKNFKSLHTRLPKSNYDNKEFDNNSNSNKQNVLRNNNSKQNVLRNNDSKQNILRNKSINLKEDKSLQKNNNRSQSEAKVLPRIVSRKQIIPQPQSKQILRRGQKQYNNNNAVVVSSGVCSNIPKPNLNHYR